MSLIFSKCIIEGVFLLNNFIANDDRGTFVKTFNKTNFESIGIKSKFEECYFSISNKNVLRGMHFQTPPYAHEKLVYVTKGEIIDVIVDLRKSSLTFGKFVQFQIKENVHSIYIPKGCAHGFLTLSDQTIVNYQVSSLYNQSADTGILCNSLGCIWPIENPILSNRDKSIIEFEKMNSPFVSKF